MAGEGETSTSGIRQNKGRLTLLTCANSIITQKVKLLFIIKYNSPRPFKGVFHLAVYNKVQMDKKLFLKWLTSVLVQKLCIISKS
jgi:hypothetical protein